MYRLMQSAKFTLEHSTLGPMSSFRQRPIGQYRQIRTALAACEKANAQGRNRHYVLDDAGREYYRGAWID